MIERTYHFAGKVNNAGDMVAICAKRDKPINLRVATWTIREGAVTCSKCRKLIGKKGKR